MTIYIIYHNADNDGMASAWIAREALIKRGEKPVLIGYQYNDPLTEIETIPDGATVYMLDVSLKVAEMVRLAERCVLTWIDHHERAYLEIFPKIRGNALVYYGDMAACRLTWAFFNPSANEPTWVNLTGRYDVFDKSDVLYWKDYILPFEYGLRAIVSDVGSFKKVSSSSFRFGWQDIVINGHSILAYLQKQADKRINDAYATDFLGFRALVISGETGDFWYNTPRYLAEKPTLLIFPRYDFAKRAWKVSLRQGADEEPCDCAELASRYGGGGHFNAAGFTVKDLPF